METVIAVVWVLFVHFVADFVMQTDEMARRKSSSNSALLDHVLIYSVVLFAGTFPWLGVSNGLVFVLINGSMHFLIDYFTSRRTSRQYQTGKRHDFFVTIGFDQWLHNAILVASFMLGI